TDDAINALIRLYTREAGVRNLERTVATVCRKVAKKIVERRKAEEVTAEPKATKKAKAPVEKATEGKTPVLPAADLEEMLGRPKYTVGKAEEQNEVGLTNGLAYTEAGGDLLQIEVSVVPGKGGVKITGKLGEVMQESAQTAMSYVRSRAEALGLDPKFYE